MPPDQRIDVTQDLLEIADRLRPEFAREVARIGAEQTDILGWHSSTFAWKTPAASDLFLLSCYRLLIRKLAVEHSEPTLIFLEDSWLYEDCRRDDDLQKVVAESTPADLSVDKALLALRGVAGRILWIGRTAVSWTRQRLHAGRRDIAASGKAKYAVYSMPHARCFGPGGKWHDPFLPGLEALILRAGGEVLRFVPPDVYGFERELAQRSDFVRPLILDAPLRELAAAVATVWRPQSLSTYALEGVSMPLLAEREWWTDAGSARWCGYRLFDTCFRRYREREKPMAVTYPYENQPWEKIICAASSKTGTTTIAYQHSVVPRFFLGYWPGPEGRGTPLPDRIVASGPLQRELLIQAGTPAAKTLVGGSMRFRYLASVSGRRQSRRPGNSRVLVIANHSLPVTQGIIDAVRAAFPDHGLKDALEFFFRPHPTSAPGSTRDVAGLTTVKGDLSSQLPDFDLIVATGSTVALEACFLGVPVILYRPALFLDTMDPGNLVPKGYFEYATAPEMRERVLRCLTEPRDTASNTGGLRDALFSPVDEQVWLRCLRGG